MRGLLLLLACGCTVADPFASDPEKSEVASLSLIEACPVGQWCVEAPPAELAAVNLHAVWALDENDVFAVGDGGAIIRRVNGNDWFQMASGTTTKLLSVWGSSASDVWVGSASSVLLHYDGTSWSQVTAPISNVDSIWGLSPTDAWFVGSSTVMHWNGSSFALASGVTGTLDRVSGTGPNDVWVSTENSYLRHYNGTLWSTMAPGSVGVSFRTVFARTATDVWAATFMPRLETTRWNGSKWTPYRTDVKGAFLSSISGQSANDVWGAGNSRIAHWTGSGGMWFTEEPFGIDATLWSVTTVPGHAWVVGDSGVIGHRLL